MTYYEFIKSLSKEEMAAFLMGAAKGLMQAQGMFFTQEDDETFDAFREELLKKMDTEVRRP